MISNRICVFADTLLYPEGGGHFWVYLNWALGFRRNGCEVVWMEHARPDSPKLARNVPALIDRLRRFGIDALALVAGNGDDADERVATGAWTLAEAAEASGLLVNFRYGAAESVVKRFRRSALMDIDSGLLQVWISEGTVKVAPHDLYFTTGETVGRGDAAFPDCGLHWRRVRPSVALPEWPVRKADSSSPFTTITNWEAREWLEFGSVSQANDKRVGFEPFLELPGRTRQSLELAVCLGDNAAEDRRLRSLGWRLRNPEEVAGSPESYREYVAASRGEFSCAKPSCILLRNAWVSDRTLCYLASGKPVVVQHTGRSEYLPEREGMFRVRDVAEAADALETAAVDYERHSRAARQLAETYFDAAANARRVLEDVV
jgi:hypothetical protein